MNRKQKRRLRRDAKVAAVCGAMLYLVGGVALGGSKEYTDEARTGGSSAVYKTFPAIPILPDKAAPPETTAFSEPAGGSGENDLSVPLYDWDADDTYLLAKIAMAEAEGEDTEGKALVILTVLNRVASRSFPDSIAEVIYQEGQFSPVSNGRFDAVNPDQDCLEALDLVAGGWNHSQNALYFESRSDSNWHRKNLEFLFQHGSHYFYTEKGTLE